MALTPRSWTPRRASLTLQTAAEEHGKSGGEAGDNSSRASLSADVNVELAGVGSQQASAATIGLPGQEHKHGSRHLWQHENRLQESAVPTLRQVVIILVASVANLQFGVGVAWPNALAGRLPSDNSTIFNHQLHFTPLEMDLVGSLLYLGFMASSLPSGWLVGWLGRRLSMAVSCLPTTLGWLLITFAHNKFMIFAGRFICGVGVMLMLDTSKIYVAEITNSSFRGMASSFADTIFFVGIFMVAAAATTMQWYFIAGINPILVLMFGGAVLALPESPAFLVIQNKEEEARKILQSIKGPKADVDAEIAVLKLRNERKDGNAGFAALFKPDMLKEVAALFVLFVMRNFSGCDVIMMHTTRMLGAIGVTLDPGVSNLIVTSVSLGGVVFLGLVVDRIGRRWSLMGSFTVMAAGHAMLGFYSHFMPPPSPIRPDLDIRLLSPLDGNATVSYLPEQSGEGDVESRLFPLYCFLGVAFANAAGIMAVPILLAVEYFPTSIRPQGLCVCMLWLDATSMAATQLYSTMMDAFTLPGLYWTYALFAIGGAVHTLLFIRETSQQNIA